MPEPMIELAAPTHRDRVVATVVAAFDRDPAFRWFFPQDYERQAAAFAALLFDTRVARSSTWVVDGGAAVAMWDRPRDPGEAREDDIDAGLAEAVAPDARDRIVAYEALVDARLPDEPHWYLGVLATHPERAGRRLGRAVMRRGLVEAGREGVPAALETTNPDNVSRYVAEGWAVNAEVDVDDLHVWILSHDGAG